MRNECGGALKTHVSTPRIWKEGEEGRGGGGGKGGVESVREGRGRTDSSRGE